jgi:putative NADH-flavin reductase
VSRPRTTDGLARRCATVDECTLPAGNGEYMLASDLSTAVKLILFGAATPVGRLVLEESLDREHEITCFVESSVDLPVASNVTIVGGEVDPASVREAVPGHDAVVSALGPTTGRPDDGVFTETLSVIADEMEANGVRRLVVLGTEGILDHPDGGLRMNDGDDTLYPVAVDDAYRQVYDRLDGSDLAWTVVCPPQIGDGEPTGNYRISTGSLPRDGEYIVDRDLARFVVEQVETDAYVRQRVGIAY